jgi:hypothetical protein
MAVVRATIGRWLFDHFQNHEAKCIDRVLDNKAAPRFNNLSLSEGRYLILTAEARAAYHPVELKLWFIYSRFYLYLMWYKGYRRLNRFQHAFGCSEATSDNYHST